MTLTERAATSMMLMVYARLAMLAVGVIGLPAGGFFAVRMINALDRVVEKQEQNGREMSALSTKVENIVSDQVRGQKNVADRIEQVERAKESDINQLRLSLQQLGAQFADLAKFVYQRVR